MTTLLLRNRQYDVNSQVLNYPSERFGSRPEPRGLSDSPPVDCPVSAVIALFRIECHTRSREFGDELILFVCDLAFGHPKLPTTVDDLADGLQPAGPNRSEEVYRQFDRCEQLIVIERAHVGRAEGRVAEVTEYPP